MTSGSGAVETMTANGACVALVEYGASEAGTALFGRDGLPRRVAAADFHPRRLQRNTRDLRGLVDEVNGVLGSIRLGRR